MTFYRPECPPHRDASHQKQTRLQLFWIHYESRRGTGSSSITVLSALWHQPVSEITYAVSSGTLNSTIPYHTISWHQCLHLLMVTIITLTVTSCSLRAAATLCLRLRAASWQYLRIQVAVLFRHKNIFISIRQVAPILACWLFKTSATSWPLTLKLVSESCVTWATYVPILVFLGLSVLELGAMYTTDRRPTSDKSIA